MDSKDFENIYKNSKEEDNKASGSDLFEKAVLTDEEEQERWYELDSGNPESFVESVSSIYYVLRKAIGKSFDENSYGIVVNSNDVSEPINRIATYNSKKVYVQKIGSKSECERLAKMIKFGLDHFKRGEIW